MTLIEHLKLLPQRVVFVPGRFTLPIEMLEQAIEILLGRFRQTQLLALPQSSHRMAKMRVDYSVKGVLKTILRAALAEARRPNFHFSGNVFILSPTS